MHCFSYSWWIRPISRRAKAVHDFIFLLKFCLRSCDILQLDKRQILHKKVHLNILVKKRPGSEAT
jgi:hypothetical protein